MTSGGGRDDFDWPHYESDSEAEVEADEDDEEDVPPPNWERWQVIRNQRETAEEIFGNPAKRRRLQQLARDALEEEKTFGALKASRKETDNDPLQCVILEISVQ